MKKLFVLLILVLLGLFLLAGCNTLSASHTEIKVTPALTPLITVAEDGAAPATSSVHIAGSSGSVLRTPIVLKVPLTPVAAASSQATPASVSTAVPPTEVAVASTPIVAPTSFEPTAPPAEAVATEPTATPYQGIPVSLDDTLNILVVGSDERHVGQPWRSDVIMVVAVDYPHRQIGVISFPRDLYVDIPTVGKNRINTATFFGGVNNYPHGGDIGLLKDTLAQNFGLRIDHYVKFNFDTFKDVIDALGGVDVTVDCPLTGKFPIEPGSSRLKWQTLQPGKYHMDGEFALRYVRERKTTSDVDRNRRQQRVLIAMRKRAREINIVPRIPALYDAMKDNIETDLGLTDIIALTRLGLQIDTKDVHGFNIGYKEVDSWTTPGGAAVLKPDMNKINEGLRTLFSKPSILKNPTKPRSCK